MRYWEKDTPLRGRIFKSYCSVFLIKLTWWLCCLIAIVACGSGIYYIINEVHNQRFAILCIVGCVVVTTLWLIWTRVLLEFQAVVFDILHELQVANRQLQEANRPEPTQDNLFRIAVDD